jgi:hypothetical protein
MLGGWGEDRDRKRERAGGREREKRLYKTRKNYFKNTDTKIQISHLIPLQYKVEFGERDREPVCA